MAGQRNRMAMLERAIAKYFFGADVSGIEASFPTVLNNQTIKGAKAGDKPSTGLLDIVKVNASDRVEFPGPVTFTGAVLLSAGASSALGSNVTTATVTTLTTAGAVTFTIAQLLGSLILRDPNGANRADVTPTAALIVAGITGCVVGSSFEFSIRNDADAAETITLTGGTSVTIKGTATIGQNAIKRFKLVVTSITASAETVDIYSLGTSVF